MEHTGRERKIFIGPRAQEILRPYLLRDPEKHCFLTPVSHKRYQTDSYHGGIIRACEAAFPPPDGLNREELIAWRKQHRWSPNRLRHAAATIIRQRFGLEAAQVTLGHASADVTQIYAERDLSLAERVMQAVG